MATSPTASSPVTLSVPMDVDSPSPTIPSSSLAAHRTAAHPVVTRSQSASRARAMMDGDCIDTPHRHPNLHRSRSRARASSVSSTNSAISVRQTRSFSAIEALKDSVEFQQQQQQQQLESLSQTTSTASPHIQHPPTHHLHHLNHHIQTHHRNDSIHTTQSSKKKMGRIKKWRKRLPKLFQRVGKKMATSSDTDTNAESDASGTNLFASVLFRNFYI
jgi:hypothetical protein